jgi:hypothetical protein
MNKSVLPILLLGCLTQALPQEKPKVYVRRFSAGPTLSIVGYGGIPGNEATLQLTTPPYQAVYINSSKMQRAGYGISAQARLTSRLAFHANVFLRRTEYKVETDIHLGTDNPNTLVDERRFSERDEDTRARYWEIPLTVRYYGKDHDVDGPRWFAELGGAVRKTANIRTTILASANAEPLQVVDTTPIKPRKEMVHGAVAGFGVQITDEIGVRVVPMVRYTRWFGSNFEGPATTTRRNQVEGILSFTF